MAKQPTSRQIQILEFIVEYMRDKGYPPSIREIGEHFAIGSLRGVTVHLDALEKKGYIHRENTPRSIRITHPSYQVNQSVGMLPVLGQIAAGAPIYSDVDAFSEQVPVPSDMVKNIDKPFLLRIKGDSMIGDGIMPRDLVLIRPQNVASRGEIVAVMVENEEATVKRIYNEGKIVKLVPSNEGHSTMEYPADQVKIIGRVVGVLRDYEGSAF